MKTLVHLFFIVPLLVSSACGLLVEEGREVVAEVGGESIRLNDMLGRIRSLPFEERAKTNDSDPSVRLEARRILLETMVTERLLIQEAESRGIDVSDEEVIATLEHEESQSTHMSDFMEGMKSSGHDHEHADQEFSRTEIDNMRHQLMVNRMLSQQLSEAAMRRYYDANIQQFSLSSPQMIYELLVVEPANSETADRVREKAIQDGATLTDSLTSLGKAQQVIFCGPAPPMPLSLIVPAMREKVQNLKPGEISMPFRLRREGKEQYAVARLIDRIDTMPYENVREVVRRKLYEGFLEELKQKYEVVYYQDKLDYRLGG